MRSRSLAIVLLRVLSIWIALDALLAVVDMIVPFMRPVSGGPTSGWTSYGNTTTQATSLYLHDTYYVVTAVAPALWPVTFRFAVAVLLYLSSARLAGYLTRDCT